MWVFCVKDCSFVVSNLVSVCLGIKTQFKIANIRAIWKAVECKTLFKDNKWKFMNNFLHCDRFITKLSIKIVIKFLFSGILLVRRTNDLTILLRIFFYWDESFVLGKWSIAPWPCLNSENCFICTTLIALLLHHPHKSRSGTAVKYFV